MKIVFTGGGTGGHFYPIIAIAQKVNEIISKEKIIKPKLYYISSEPYDKEALFENNLIFEKIDSGKIRLYFSIQNFFDIFKTFFGILKGIYKLFLIYPDVVFSKGGYASFPIVCAAFLLRIPIIMHESDYSPGKVNLFTSKFAKRIAVSYKETIDIMPKEKTIYTGQPVRNEILQKEERETSLNFWKLESDKPIILIIGGSQGAELINNAIIDILPELVKKYQIIHQTGVKNYKNVIDRATVVLQESKDRARYNPVNFLNPLQMKMAAGASSLIISRAGSTIFEIASWGIPSILIPFTISNGDHSKKNAFAYARSGSCVVIEEMNLKPHIIISEIERILENEKIYKSMSQNALAFFKSDAPYTIAKEIIDIALSHSK